MIECTDYDFLRVIAALKTIVLIIKIAVPLLIIIKGTLDFFKLTIDGTPEAAKKGAQTILIRVVAGALIFFIPSLTDIFMGYVNGYSDAQNTYTICLNNSEKLEYYKALKEERIAFEKKEREEALAESEKLRKEKEKEKIATMEAKQTYDSSSTTEGTIPGKKYNISDADLDYITSIALCEVGEDGILAEISQMLNRYEMYGDPSESIPHYILHDVDGDGLGNGFYQCANEGNGKPTTPSALAKAKDVIVLGNRTLPPYIDEQDCPSCNCQASSNGTCIRKVVVNGTTYSDRASVRTVGAPVYIQDKSRVYNAMDGDYTYYSRACDYLACDIYGYTDQALARYKKLNNGS